jgi:hypothetical protein
LIIFFSDPFAGWPGSIGGLPGPGPNDYFPTQGGSSNIVPGLGQASSLAAASGQLSGQLPSHQRQGSFDQFGYPAISPQLTPSNNPERFQYAAGSPLEQYQYSPSRARTAISHSQYPLSPNPLGAGAGFHPTDPNARYSPSFKGVNVPYSPEQSFLNQVIAELEGRQGSNAPVHGRSVVSNGQIPSVQAVSSALGQATATIQLPLTGTPSRASSGIEPRRSLIVDGVHRETGHASIIELFPVGCVIE